MAERQDARYEETTDPHNPPQAVVNPQARNTAFWSYLGPLIAVFAIIALALAYWSGRGSGGERDGNTLNPSIGTTGERIDDNKPARDLEQGGGDPAPRPGSTQQELEERGTGN